MFDPYLCTRTAASNADHVQFDSVADHNQANVVVGDLAELL